MLVAGTVAVVVLGGDLVEIGENTRFRSTIDPLLIAFPLGALVLAVQRRLGRGGDDRDEPTSPPTSSPAGRADGTAAPALS